MTVNNPGKQAPSSPRRNPNLYKGLLSILIIALAILTIYSFCPTDFLGIKRAPIAAFLSGDNQSDTAELQAPPAVDSVNVVDSTHQSFLLIGDSMLEGLSPRLLEYAVHNGHELNSVLWYSSTTKYFGQCDTLSYFIRKYKPTYILLSIGANELFVRDIKKERSAFVAHIIKEIDTIPFVWIGPPNWRDDTGINEMIVEHVGSKRYFPSKRLTFDRAKDGAHPTHQSAARWADSLASWIRDSSAHRVLLYQPDTTVKCVGNGIKQLLKPLR